MENENATNLKDRQEDNNLKRIPVYFEVEFDEEWQYNNYGGKWKKPLPASQ